jgi:hypothetical protein
MVISLRHQHTRSTPGAHQEHQEHISTPAHQEHTNTPGAHQHTKSTSAHQHTRSTPGAHQEHISTPAQQEHTKSTSAHQEHTSTPGAHQEHTRSTPAHQHTRSTPRAHQEHTSTPGAHHTSFGSRACLPTCFAPSRASGYKNIIIEIKSFKLDALFIYLLKGCQSMAFGSLLSHFMSSDVTVTILFL